MIYFIYDKVNKAVKIGSTKRLKERLVSLQIGNPTPLEVLYTIDGCNIEEKLLHRHYKLYRISGEWFKYEGQLRKDVENKKVVKVLNELKKLNEDYIEYCYSKKSNHWSTKKKSKFDGLIEEKLTELIALNKPVQSKTKLCCDIARQIDTSEITVMKYLSNFSETDIVKKVMRLIVLKKYKNTERMIHCLNEKQKTQCIKVVLDKNRKKPTQHVKTTFKRITEALQNVVDENLTFECKSHLISYIAYRFKTSNTTIYRYFRENENKDLVQNCLNLISETQSDKHTNG